MQAQEPLPALQGEPADPLQLPEGCVFAPRCPYSTERCRAALPEMQKVGENWYAACHLLGGEAK